MFRLICIFGILGILGLAGCKSMETFLPKSPLLGYDESAQKAKSEEYKIKFQIEGFDFSDNDIFGIKPGINVSDFDISPDRRLNLMPLFVNSKGLTNNYIHKKPYNKYMKPKELVLVDTIKNGDDKTVYYVQRMTHYEEDDLRPLRNDLIETLIEKYGPPTYTLKYGTRKRTSPHISLYWSYNKNGLLISPDYNKYNIPKYKNKKSSSTVDMFIKKMGYINPPFRFPSFPESDLLMVEKIGVAALSMLDFSKNDCVMQRKSCERMISANIISNNKMDTLEVSYFGMILADMRLYDNIKTSEIARLRIEEENKKKLQFEKQKNMDIEL